MISNTLEVDKKHLTFTILRDPLSALYDIYFNIGEMEYRKRILRPDEGNIPVQFSLNYEGNFHEGQLVIYAYDLNVSDYLTKSVTVKPNTYQDSYSTVNNGYGSFGSLNVLEKTIHF